MAVFDVEGMIEDPNTTFWFVAVLFVALFGASVVWPGTLPALSEFARPMPTTVAFSVGMKIATALVGVLGAGLVLAFVEPRRVGHGFVIGRIFWRVLRFCFAVVAAGLLACFTYLLIALVVGMIRRVSDDDGDRNIATLFKAGMVLVAVVGVLCVKVLPRLVGDLGRLLVASYRAIRVDLWARRRIRAASAPFVPTSAAAPQVLIVSDLHLTAEDARTIEGDLEDGATGGFLDEVIGRVAPKLVVAAGDVTDTGAPAAWDKANRIARSWGAPVYASPGNHDVNFLGFARPNRRLRALAEAINLDPASEQRGSYSAAEIDVRMGALMRATGVELPDGYPALLQHDELRLSVLLLDSNRRASTSPISNALGLVGQAQLRQATRLLDRRPAGYGLIIVLHHHIFPAGRWQKDDLFLVCFDASEVLRLAFAHRAEAIIHGHKHMPYVRTLRDGDHTLRLISAGSAMYPAKGPCATEVETPSVFGLVLDGGRLVDVTLHRPATRARRANAG